MGNCQAIDNASFVIQHPNGKVESFYWPISVNEVMKMNPGHYVALLLTTTMHSSSAATGTSTGKPPIRITRIKLLRPTDALVIGHVYRLVTYQEVMKGLLAKKQARMKQYGDKQGKIMADFEAVLGKTDAQNDNKQVKQEKQRSRNSNTPGNSAVFKSRGWQPSLKSISEAGT